MLKELLDDEVERGLKVDLTKKNTGNRRRQSLKFAKNPMNTGSYVA